METPTRLAVSCLRPLSTSLPSYHSLALPDDFLLSVHALRTRTREAQVASGGNISRAVDQGERDRPELGEEVTCTNPSGYAVDLTRTHEGVVHAHLGTQIELDPEFRTSEPEPDLGRAEGRQRAQLNRTNVAGRALRSCDTALVGWNGDTISVRAIGERHCIDGRALAARLR